MIKKNLKQNKKDKPQSNSLLLNRNAILEKQLAKKNHELEIESALERVRTVAMGMKEPADMLNICKTISQQLQKLGVKEIRNVQTAIIYQHKGAYMNYEYYAKHDKLLTTEVSYTDHPMSKAFVKQMLSGQNGFFKKNLKGKKVQEWYAFQKSNTKQFADKYLMKATSLTYHWYSLGPVALGISTYEPLSKEEQELFIRFRNVFELSYRRYLDIEKAEAQAREAKIEASLERVRSRSMGMQKSDELKEVIQIVYEQFIHLNINIEHTGFVVDYKLKGDWHFWIADKQEIPSKISHPYFDSVWANQFNEAKEKGINFFTTHLNFKEKNKFYRKLLSYFPELPEKSTQFYLRSPGVAVSTVLFDNVSLYIENFSAIPYTDEENAVLMRFGKVFQQTYTRFLDLQKAEAQSRESKIQLALERARAQSMMMQHSAELDDTLRVFHEQVLLLNIPSAFSFLWLPDEEKDKHIFWAVWAENNSTVFKSKAINYPLDRNEPATAQCLVDWKGNEPVVSYHVPPDGVANYFAAWSELIAGAEELKPEYFSDGLYYVEAFIKYGCFGVIVKSGLQEDEKNILYRFAVEFERTYTRFLDLQKAEAQAREAQIEAALEKVRSRSLAMQHSLELNQVINEVSEQLITLGFDFDAGNFVTDITPQGYTLWVSAPGASVPAELYVPYKDIALINWFFKTHRSKTATNTHVFSKEEKDEYFNYYFSETNGRNIPEERKKYILNAASLSISAAFKKDFILSVFNYRGIIYTQEQNNILWRFANVFDQCYTRFLDLQKVEAQALQAEKDLIAIKEAKQKAEEALTELKATQKQLIQSEKMASLGELTAGIAHEIQNPLNFVNNFSEVSKELLDEMKEELEKGNTEDAKEIMNDVIQNLEKINLHGNRADGIVKGMLQHSRTSSGQKELTDINALCDEYLRLAYHGLRAKDKSFNAIPITIGIETSFDDSIEKINVVPQEIGRVVLNLINNAFYAVSEKQKQVAEEMIPFKKVSSLYKPSVTVITKKLTDKIYISVADNGNGIPEAIKEKIFQPFFTTKPTGQGTGLGLSLSYDIIKAHGGEIKVETKDGEGTAFIVYLPVN